MATVVKGRHYRTGQKLSLSMENGRISSISYDEHLKNEDDVKGELPWIAPGLVDLQINGYRGMDFNAGNVTEDMVRSICGAIAREGVTSFFPTVITNSDEAIRQELSTIANCTLDSDSSLCDCIAGIHLEGPFISPEDGPRGAHGKQFVKSPDFELFQKWQDAAQGMIRIITLSPEWPGATAFIEKCVDSDVTVSIGHTAASPEAIRDAVAAGARMSTHLGNGSHVVLPRHLNYVFEQMASDDLWACFIADGFHLPPAFLKMGLRTKGHRAMLVSDAVSLCGMPPGDYESHVGGKVTLRRDGKLHLTGNDKILAGSAQMLIEGISHLVENGLATLPDAWEMASVRPAAFMGLPAARGLTVGAPADVVVFRAHPQAKGFEILQTYKQGRLTPFQA